MVKKALRNGSQLIMYETFQEFEKMINSERISGRDDSSRSSSEDFAGTRSWEHAEKLRMYGDKESAGMISKFSSQLENVMEKVVKERTRNYNDVAGFQPIVPNAIMNLPISMINQKRVVKKGKIIKLFCDMGFSASTKKEALAYRGALILSVIDSYEKQGYRIELLTGVTSHSGSNTFGFILPIKKSGQPLNVLKTAYYIVNPSFLRRTYFQFCESVKDIKDITHGGYGGQRNEDDRKKALEKIIDDDCVIINSDFFPRERNGDEDNIRELTRYIDSELEKLKRKSEKKRTRK